VRTYSIDELRKEGQSLGRDQFLAKHMAPFLVLDQLGSSGADSEIFATVAGGAKAARPVLPSGAPLPRTKAAVIEKRKGANDFTNMITIGRAGNNDIALEVSSISKFHAYFMKEPRDGRWFLHDAGSSNGTWLDGERLGGSQAKAPLREGGVIQLGPDARTRFFQATALYDLLITK
jgi:pSer/pThr/pTyr-binding forkhead associated (FHA) protein